MAEDFYSILEVPRNASQDDIKKAYRRLAMKYHPDHNPGDKTAEEKFKNIGAAYEVLGNEEKKRIYDQVGHEAYTRSGQGGGPGGPGGFNVNFEDLGDVFGSMFGDMFGGGGGGRRARDPNAPMRGSDLEYNLRLTFNEAVKGCVKEIGFTLKDTCGTCRGSGAEPGTSRKKCPKCNGTGQILMSRGFFQMKSTCPNCRGMGSIVEKPCHDCHGEGKVSRKRSVKLNIPAGVDSGSRLRSAGNGETGRMGGPNGDLYVTLVVEEHPIFKREGLNLFVEVPIPFTKAALGGEVEVPTIDGPDKIKVPAGTQNGTDIRMAGKGVPSPSSKGRRGDQFVRVSIEVPVKLSSEQKEILQKFDASCTKEEHPRFKAFMDKIKKLFN